MFGPYGRHHFKADPEIIAFKDVHSKGESNDMDAREIIRKSVFVPASDRLEHSEISSYPWVGLWLLGVHRK